MRTHSAPIPNLQSPVSTLRRGLTGLLLVTLLLALAVLALNFTGAQAQPPAPPVDPVVASTNPTIEYAPNTALLKLKPGVALAAGDVSAAGVAVTANAASLDGLLGALGVVSAKPVFASAGGVMAAQSGLTDATGLARIYRVQWTSTIPVAHAVAALAADPAVEYAEPDYIARAARTPNDPEYAAQWALPKINAPAAWDVTTGAADVVIAIIDSGVDTAHPDFAGRLWQNDDPANGADDDHNGQVDDTNGWNILTGNGNLTDPSGHGSQVGGVAGAATDNGAGVAGVCWGCKLMFVNAMQASGVANYSDIAAAVQYAASNGAQVINLSLGGYADSAALRDAIREAATTAVIVAGAGNDDSGTPFYPAAYPEVVAVAATDPADQKAIFSNYGAWVDVSAPGKDIRTTTVSGYATDSGTSLAAPFVAGLAGLVKSQHPAWTAEQVKWQLLNTAVAIDALNPARAGQLGKGRIDAGAALAVDPQPRAAVESYAIDGQANARPAPGQAFQLVLTVRNLWLLGQNLQGVLSSSDPYVSITDAAGAFGDIAPGQPGSNSGDPFGVTVSGGAPYNHALQFTLNLSGAGGYSLAVPFTIQVRSSTETLGNTIYSVDTTWTSDKTYVLAGAVIVNPGATLTIQPGTVIKGNPGKFLRVDGTLIARGTAAQPIVFTTNSITNATWSGIRFADTAVDASYDAGGNYVAGSVLQFVEVSYADVAASLSTRSPYIADSMFTNNATSIQVGNNNNGGSPHIERNSFTGGNAMYGAITLSGGQPLIQQNSFVGGSTSIGNNMGMSSSGGPSILYNTFRNGAAPISLSGSPIIIGNVIQNNTGTAINVSCCVSNAPVIRDNVIVGNGGGINGSNLQLVDIEHNLIANNGGTGGGMCPPNCGGGAALALDVQSSGFGQSYPALAYAPDRDEYLLIWSERIAVMDVIKAQRLTGDGQKIGREISLGSGAHSAVAYNTTDHEYLVIHSEMMFQTGTMQRLASDGTPIGAATSIPMVMNSNVRVIYQPADNSYLIGWEKERGGMNNVFVRHVAANGTWLSDEMSIGEDVDQSYKSIGEMAYNANAQRALVAFRASFQGSRIFGGWVVGNSTAFSSTVLSEDTAWGVRDIGLTFGGAPGNYFAVWERLSTPSEAAPIKGQSVNADGSVSVAQTVLISDTGRAYAPGVAYSSAAGEFFSVWLYNPTPAVAPPLTKLYGQRLTSAGALNGAPVLISSPASNGAQGVTMSSLAIAYNSQRNEYLVAWADDRTGVNSIWAQRISAAGQLLDNAWTPLDETNPANNFRIGEWRGVRNNTIIHNTGYGIQLGGAAAASVTIANNNLFGNNSYDLYLSGGQAGTQNFTVDAANNFWNVDASQIAERIRDCTFDDNGCGTASSTVGQVAYNPPLANPDQTAPAYVRSVTMNPNPVGLERGTVTLDFSKPMSVTALPVASFYDGRRGTTQQVFSETATVIAKDVFGHTWFGLNNMMSGASGVRMYDGRQWTSYTTANSGLGNNNVTAIYGAANGDVWFGHGFGGEVAVSRLHAAVWISYTREIAAPIPTPGQGTPTPTPTPAPTPTPQVQKVESQVETFPVTSQNWLGHIYSIGEDNQGAMWFGTDTGVYRYTGATWRQYTTSDGLASNNVQRIVRDGQGRMWFQTDQGLSVFDGATWTKHNASTGMPANPFQSLYADSQGRVWVGLSTGAIIVPNRPYLAMYDGAGWHYFGATETNSRLTCDVNGIAESPDGVLWFRSCGSAITYDGTTWSTASYGGGYTTAFLFDYRANLWYGDSMGGGTSVHWGGLDHPFTDGQWLSPTRFQASYDFDANVSPGFYTVQTDGAFGGDGMAAYAGSNATFQVAFGGGVTLDPPAPPQVVAQTDGSLTQLAASWQANSPNLDQYRYGIGTTPGGRDVVGWTYLTGTSFTRGDLALKSGQSYYVTVGARNTSGLWSIDAVSNVVIGGQRTASKLYLPSVRR
jgi:subtilisin family serine protease